MSPRPPAEKDTDLATVRQAKRYAGQVAQATMAEMTQRDEATERTLAAFAERLARVEAADRSEMLGMRITHAVARVAALERYAGASLLARLRWRWRRYWHGADAVGL